MKDLPYRPCVGIALANMQGGVFIGRRKAKGGGEVLDSAAWQMPQGGIDEGEAPLDAARRELREETNVRSATLIAEHPGWLSYDLPPDALGPRWAGRYRGQTQKWFLFRFTGEEAEIDIENPDGGEPQEFDAWRWERLDRLPGLIVPFKRAVYEQVASAFAPLAGPNAR